MYLNIAIRPLLLLLAIVVLLAPLSTRAEYASLPEMGDSATTTLDAETSRQIGQAMMRQIDRSGLINDDPIVMDYIQRLGRDLASGAMVGEQHFSFFVLNERSINAFAMPGGYIGAHAGLILASQSENELASVMAHEIAHVTQHHIARSVEKAKQMNLPLTAAVIAAILLGASDPALANAALAASIGAGQQMQIDFTRANEKEADRVGMQLLYSAGFDPRGMADFFLRLQQDSRFASSSLPEFLRTHPITTDRLAEAQERAERYPPSHRADSRSYQLVRARLILQHTDSTERLLEQVNKQDPGLRLDEESSQYLLALLHQQRHEHDASRPLFEALLEKNPQRIAYIDALAKLELAAGKADVASKHYRQGLEYYPDNELLGLGLARALIAQGELTRAREYLQQLTARKPGASAMALRLLAQTEEGLGNMAASHLALAEYYLLLDEPHSALNQLQIARRQQPLDDYHAARIEAYTEEVKQRMSSAQRAP